jgi:hypothetical protein
MKFENLVSFEAMHAPRGEMTHHTRSMADDAAAPEEAAAAAAEGGAAGSPAKHKRSALAPRIKRLMQARAPAYRAALPPL